MLQEQAQPLQVLDVIQILEDLFIFRVCGGLAGNQITVNNTLHKSELFVDRSKSCKKYNYYLSWKEVLFSNCLQALKPCKQSLKLARDSYYSI